MILKRGLAVVATAFPDAALCMRRWLEEAGFSEVICVSNGRIALDTVIRRLPDVLVADAVLPGLDGTSLAERICALPLAVYPAIIVLALPGMRPAVSEDSFAVIEKPGTAELLLEAIDSMHPLRRVIPAEKRALAEEALKDVGVPEHAGREYLLRAIELVWLDSRLLKSLTTRLYPAVAEQFGVNARSAERAMRHVIDAAWRSGEIEAQYRLFGETIDASRGCPTCGEMIAQIADILRWEGKA